MSDRGGGIHVNLGDLKQFAEFLEKETVDNLDVHTETVWRTGLGPFPFATGVPGDAIGEVRARYGTCYAETAKALNGYVRASQVLIHAIREVAKYYGGADALSNQNIGQVNAALSYAQTEAARIEREATAAATAAETDRESRRTERG